MEIISIVGEFITELQGILENNIFDLDSEIKGDIKADADEALTKILEDNTLKSRGTIDIKKRFSRELGKIGYKLQQLEDGRVYEPSQGKFSKMDGSLYTNVIQLKEMLNDLLDKIENNKQSDNEKLSKYFRDYKI